MLKVTFLMPFGTDSVQGLEMILTVGKQCPYLESGCDSAAMQAFYAVSALT